MKDSTSRPRVKFGIDASVEAAGLKLGLDGLTITSPPLVNPQTDPIPQFGLQGITLSYSQGSALEIAGAFLRDGDQFLGARVPLPEFVPNGLMLGSLLLGPLDDFALFSAIKTAHNGAAWTQWAPPLAAYNKSALEEFRAAHLAEIQQVCNPFGIGCDELLTRRRNGTLPRFTCRNR